MRPPGPGGPGGPPGPGGWGPPAPFPRPIGLLGGFFDGLCNTVSSWYVNLLLRSLVIMLYRH